MRHDLGLTGATPAIIGSLAELHREQNRVFREVDACIAEATRLCHPILMAESLLTKGIVYLVCIVNDRLFMMKPGDVPPPIPENVFSDLLTNLQMAEEFFNRAGNSEGSVRATLTEADWLEVNGRKEAALELAISVEGIASGMGYAGLVSRIAAFRTDQTDYSQMMRSIATPESRDHAIAEASNEQLRRFAEDMRVSLNLPLDRLPMLERDFQSMRAITTEQLHWCRHIELLQDLTHTQSPSTFYAIDPNRTCVCSLKSLRTTAKTPDWTTIITSFKTMHCAGCSDRSPTILTAK